MLSGLYPNNKWLTKLESCPDCKQRTTLLCWHTPWYGTDATCIKCGRRWQDGEWMDLQFIRGSRQKSIDEAKRIWRSIELKRANDESYN